MADEPAELDLGLDPAEPPPPRKTPEWRLRRRQSIAIDHGFHPLTGEPLRLVPEGAAEETCGSCVFRVLSRHASKAYPKCVRPDGVRPTRGPATDVRASWPACPAWKPRSPE